MTLPSDLSRPDNVGDLWIAVVARSECANYIAPFRPENRVPRQRLMHRGRLLVIAQFLKRELTGTSGINPFWACDTGRDEQPELLVVLGGESHPLDRKTTSRSLRREAGFCSNASGVRHPRHRGSSSKAPSRGHATARPRCRPSADK